MNQENFSGQAGPNVQPRQPGQPGQRGYGGHASVRPPNGLAGAKPVKKRGWSPARAFIAVLIALAMVLAGVIVSVAVLRGPEVRADAPLDPATPAVHGGESGQGEADPVEAPDLKGQSFTIPVPDSEGETLTLDVDGAWRYDSSDGNSIHGHYPWLNDDVAHTVIETTVTNNGNTAVFLQGTFQAFVRTDTGDYVRAEAVFLTTDSYAFAEVDPGETVDVTLVVPTLKEQNAEAFGISIGSNWHDSATWLDLNVLPVLDYSD